MRTGGKGEGDRGEADEEDEMVGWHPVNGREGESESCSAVFDSL